MKEVTVKANVPPGGYFYYVDADSGARFQHPYYDELFKMATKHRQVNNFKMDDMWEHVFSDNVCQNTPTAPCAEFYSQTALDKMTRFGKALLGWARQGFAVVSEQVLEERYNTCQVCPYYGGSTEVWRVSCKKCGCSGLKQHLPNSKCPDNPPRWNAIV